MADKSQFLRGTLEGCILKIIANRETYGYEIAERLKEYGFSEISEGTIYPILLRLEKNNFITSIKRASAYGPKRKYYNLTDEGKMELKEFYEIWCSIRESIDNIFSNYGGK